MLSTNKIVTSIGIALVMIGTILSLWSVLNTKTSDVGTYDSCSGESQQQKFREQKRQVIIGIMLIVLGSLMQCGALFFL